jgi:hypothetical protein
MGILILPPSFEEELPTSSAENEYYDSDGDASMLDVDGRPSKRMKFSSNSTVVPGETITDEPQWMRYTRPHPHLSH